MFRKKQKVLCYVLIFDQFDVIKRSLDFLTRYSSDIDIVVIENPSPNSGDIGAYINSLGKQQLIKRHYVMQQNIAANAFAMIIEHERTSIASQRFVILTDGDVVSKQPNWLKEEISIMKKHASIFACGVTLELSNLPLKTYPNAREEWIPTDIAVHKDYAEVTTGIHLLMFRGRQLLDFQDWKDKNSLNFVDGNMHRYCYDERKQKWARTKTSTAYHITWDLYNDPEHPYAKLKKTKSFDEIWHNNLRSEYSVTDYA